MSNDSLARGARSATYGMPIVTQKHWDNIFGAEDKTPPKVKQPKQKKKEDCSPSGG